MRTLKMFVVMRNSKLVERRTWRLVNGYWVCVDHDEIWTLANYLSNYGFYIPETIDYCLAQNECFCLKYRVFGGEIITYINRKI